MYTEFKVNLVKRIQENNEKNKIIFQSVYFLRALSLAET